MKLTCDLCGGELQMNAGGQSAICTQCGLSHSMERLKEKLAASGEANIQTTNTEEKPIYDCADYEVVTTEPERVLRLQSKKSLTLFAVKVYIDGEPCAVLKKPGSTAQIPISQGEHEIAFQIATTGVDTLGPETFRVGDKDLNGLLYLQRGAFGAQYKFDMWEDD